jgi:hypothetical protein
MLPRAAHHPGAGCRLRLGAPMGFVMNGGDANLALAYAASDAYQQEAANLVVIDEVLEELHQRVEISDLQYSHLRAQLREVLSTNRTAPGIMRIMALADAARVSAAEGSMARRRRDRRYWRKQEEQAHAELTKSLAATMDALLAEQ